MPTLGHLVFILAFVSLAHSALIVPYWQPLSEVPRQQQEMVVKPDQDDHPNIASGLLCLDLGYLVGWSCVDSEVLLDLERFFNAEREYTMLRKF